MFESTHTTMRFRRALLQAVGLVILLIASALPVAAEAPRAYSDWGEGTPVAAANTAAHDGCPIESPNGKQLFIASNRPGGFPGPTNDIWVADRANKHEPWGPMQNLGAPVNSEYNDFCPTPLGGGWLLFVSNRPAENCAGASPNGDIYITRQRNDGSWDTPQHLGCYPSGPNFAGAEFGPSLVETSRGTLLYFSSNGSDGVGDQDIYVSHQMRDGTFGPATPVVELNTSAEETMPNVSQDGRELVFASNRSGSEAGSMDIWSATWDRSTDAWSDITNLANVNTSAPESRPSLSGDGTRLYFGRGAPPGDVFVSTRVVLNADD